MLGLVRVKKCPAGFDPPGGGIDRRKHIKKYVKKTCDAVKSTRSNYSYEYA